MDNKSDVKAIMARFQAGGTSIEPGAGGRPKAAVHPTLSGPAVPSKKPFLESSLSGSAAAAATANSTTPKPCYLKNTSSTKSAPESRESPRPKAFVSRFENSTTNSNEDSKPPFIKNVKPKPPDSSQDSELKPLFPKPVLQKPSANSATLESKNTFPKPPPVTNKPPWAPKTENNGSSPAATPPKMPPAPKPTSSIARMRQQPESESKDGEPVIKPFTGSGVKPSSFRAAHSVFKKVEEAAKEDSKPLSSKESSASTPATPPKPNYGRKPSASSMQSANDDPSAPKRKPLPNILAIGSAPSKPNRPPRVNLDKFKKSAESPSEGPEIKKGGPPPPPAAHPSHTASDLRPSLPPRPPGAIIPPDQDENYDDVGELKDSLGGSFSKQAEGSGSDEEMYEDLDERWSKVEAKEQDKKREKEEKKRAEQEKKDQKERERKDQEARKKFKLSGPLQVIHKVKARVDSKGGKNDLSIKQGEPIEILRITDNPEGRWLARTRDGSFGYVKTDQVEIDFDKLKNQGLSLPSQMDHDDGEVYDDVAPQEELNRSHGGSGLVLPPPPEGDDVYDDLDDPSLMVSNPESRFLQKPRSFFRMLKVPIDRRKSPVFNNEVPPPSQFNQDGNTDQSTEEIYDDVDQFPPPPPLSSLPKLRPKAEIKTDDPKKQKKFEKEEKEFRKKFKFEGEIQVMYQVTAACNKKASGRDLAVQVGEILDVISNSESDKLICRNKEGKFGYVSTSNIQSEDNDIYDDIGDDCIYDND
ncbi:FYN-binding protein 1 isoform X1 [Astyanax mexicanus]|uniref:FYN-binding protein 1 isoform X1 n=1 Tax=Astyanax mexicanus TaxID=7994 RepID=UPI0020CB2ABE|nr:FYN-binding protein 1 isoform X1 [Astyanax mexicanus]